jgi:hypothetical protein
MLTKIISFSSGKKQLPLSSLMIIALIEACEKQNAGISFGPGDIKGSFASLITRGLVIKKLATIKNHNESSWQVTAEAIVMLTSLGIEVPCKFP